MNITAICIKEDTTNRVKAGEAFEYISHAKGGWLHLRAPGGKAIATSLTSFEFRNRLGHKIDITTLNRHPRRTRTKRYGVMACRPDGGLVALTEESLRMGWSDTEGSNKISLWCDAAGAERYVDMIRNGDGFEKNATAFIVRVHSKQSPIVVHMDQWVNKSNYRFTYREATRLP